MSVEGHLQKETKVLQHSELLTRQYLLSCHKTSHPCNEIRQSDPPPHNIRKIATLYTQNTAHLTTSGTRYITAEEYKSRLKNQHRSAVEDAITGRSEDTCICWCYKNSITFHSYYYSSLRKNEFLFTYHIILFFKKSIKFCCVMWGVEVYYVNIVSKLLLKVKMYKMK